VNSADFGALFDSFTTSVFRLEQRPSYSVGGSEADRLTAFRDGTPRPERSVRTSPWLARIATSTIVDSKTWTRVRVVDDPLTEYQRAQLESYKESQAVGEQIRITGRVDRVHTVPDFWLFDAGTDRAHVVLMHYDNDGSVLEREPVTDPGQVEALTRFSELLISESVPLNEFLADWSSAVTDG